jgi:TadE-like protein
MRSSFSRARLNRLSRDRGSEIAEAAVVLPVLFLLLFSIYWFGRAFSIYSTINHAAREGARTAAVPGCANCAAGCTWQASNLPCDAPVASAVDNALTAAHLDPQQMQPFVPTPAPVPCPGAIPSGMCATASSGGFTICRNVALDQNSSAPQVCGVIISFRYPYQLALPFSSLSNQRVLLKAEVEMQGEN